LVQPQISAGHTVAKRPGPHRQANTPKEQLTHRPAQIEHAAPHAVQQCDDASPLIEIEAAIVTTLSHRQLTHFEENA
jgi:hypothetical protein